MSSQVLIKHLDMAAQSSKWSSLQKTDLYFTWLRKLLQNDLSTKNYAFNMMILRTDLSTSAGASSPYCCTK